MRTYSFFTSGSLQDRLITLLASPFVLGTNRNWATYFGTYNFPEVTSYMGILALIAACSLFLRKWRTRPEARHWWVWYVIIALGVVSAFGRQTPFGHVLFLIPGVNSQRLLNRNLLLVDVALAVLFAWWCHLMLSGREAAELRPPTLAERWRSGRRSEIVVPAIPFAVVTVICLFLWIEGPLLYRWLEVTAAVSGSTRYELAVLVTGGAVIAGAATWIVLSERRFSRRGLRNLLAAVLAVDLVVFNIYAIVPPISEAQAQAQTPQAAALATLTGNGRFIIYDPYLLDTAQLYALGQTDLNIFTGVPSAQGYTALTDGAYYGATGAHLQETLNPATLGTSVWDGLNVTALLALPTYFLERLPGPANRPTAPASDTVFVPAAAVPAPVPAPTTVEAGRTGDWYFGGVLTVSRVTVPVDRGPVRGLAVGLITPAGGVRWLPPDRASVSAATGRRLLHVTLAGPTRAGGLVVRAGPAPLTVGPPVAATAEAGTVSLDGPLQGVVRPPHWVFVGTIGTFGAFHNTRAEGWARLRAPGPVPAGSSLRVGPTGPDGGQQITVHATGAVVLVRSESWSPGWRATVASARSGTGGGPWGPARPVAVRRDGIVQQVVLPGPGDFLVTFRYAARPALIGVAISAAAAVVLTGWAVAEAVRARRRRPGRTDPPGPTAT